MILRLTPLALCLLLATGCASMEPALRTSVTIDAPPAQTPATRPASRQAAALEADAAAQDTGKTAAEGARSHLYPGTDELFKRNIAPKVDPVLSSGAGVSLNFENVPIGNLAAALLGDLLHLNYTIDAGNDVTISLRTRQPLPRGQVLDVLDTALLPHDLAIVRDSAGVYHVTKRSATAGTRPVLDSAKLKQLAGSGTMIVPLNYIGASEMAKILAPLAPRESIVYVDRIRNLLVLQGSKAQLQGWMDLVDAFDVDFLKGMSLGVFVLENANVNVVRDALQAMLSAGGAAAGADPFAGNAAAAPAAGGAAGAATAKGVPAAAAPTTDMGSGASQPITDAAAGSPLSDLIRVFPVERLNAIVVVTPRRHMLSQVETWIRRLDQPTDSLEPRLYVYPVQNASATHLAEMLNNLFGASQTTTQPGIAAGTAPTQFGAASAPGVVGSGTGMGGLQTTGITGMGTTSGSTLGTLGAPKLGNTGVATPGPLTTTVRLEGNVRVVADDKRNALLIRAPRAEYRRIEQALRQLDTAPTQVLIEASIVEVSLTGNLKYGVEWFIENSMSRDRVGQALLNNRTDGGAIGAQTPGFSYTILNRAGAVRATLNALAANSQLRVLSNPSVLVLDNHSATILVGKQQPIKQSTSISTNSNLLTESIVYKDTGVMLNVTPSVNAGGLVTLDILQQVTDVGDIDSATGQRAFLTRQIQSRVAVRSGDPIVLGGVMSENESTGNSGVPGLRNIPILGALFSTDTSTSARTELLVVITPRVIEDDEALRAASAEMRERMRSLTLQNVLLPPGSGAQPAPAEPARPAPPQ
ncbi:type II secretion system secretin GspD [Comamonas sp. SCN 65-56]|uniref:type II secretion system secretin GspD n=1 Tax=Comamonas sp. SCN 65-56 TaxID=1660095 RepID=UPI000A597649|nr:type II secretion system secretin GspD [Comamonas sp. SCN 65-56]